MDAALSLVRGQLPTVGAMVLFPTLLERAYEQRVNDQMLPLAIVQLKTEGFLREEVGRNPATRAMEHRLIRIGG